MRLWVDFNDLRDDDRVEANLRFADFFNPADLIEGAVTSLFDGSGYECQGVIRRIQADSRVVEVELNWATWRDPDLVVRDRVAEPLGVQPVLPPVSIYPQAAVAG